LEIPNSSKDRKERHLKRGTEKKLCSWISDLKIEIMKQKGDKRPGGSGDE